MRILQISRMSPARKAESSLAAFTLLEAICRAGHHVTYAWFPDRHDWEDVVAARELVEACEGKLTLLPLAGPANWIDDPLQAFRAALRAAVVLGPHLPFLLARPGRLVPAVQRLAYLVRRFDPRPVRQLERLLAANAYDVVQFDYPWTIRLAAQLPRVAPSVFVAHELQWQAVGQMFPGHRRLHQAVRRLERRALRHYDAVVTLSRHDAALLRDEMGLPRVEYSPLPLPARSIAEPAPLRRPGGAVHFSFLGGCRHHPNVDALYWLVRRIMPRLRVAFPYRKLRVVGRWTLRHQQALAADDIVFAGVVGDLAGALRQSIFLCPLRIGSGQRIKILDAILCGVPVISTRIGARGLGLIEGQHYLPAETPQAFADQAVRLLRDPALAERMVRRAQQHVLQHFTPQQTARRRIEVLRGVAGLDEEETPGVRRAA